MMGMLVRLGGVSARYGHARARLRLVPRVRVRYGFPPRFLALPSRLRGHRRRDPVRPSDRSDRRTCDAGRCGLAVIGFGLTYPVEPYVPLDPWLVVSGGRCVRRLRGARSPFRTRTFLGYIKLDDTANYMACSIGRMGHAYNITGLAPSTYQAFLDDIYTVGYPLGSLLPSASAVTRWTRCARGSGSRILLPRRPALRLRSTHSYRAIVRRAPPCRRRCRGSAGRLVYGYALWGGIKEFAMAMLVLADRRACAGRR